MSARYATIITDDDGREVVSAIGAFEVAPQARAGRFEQIVSGVLIGMVRGGPVDAVGGFGFPMGSQGVDGRAVGIARANLKARPDTARRETAQHDGAPANAAAKADTARPTRKQAAAKSAPAKSRKAQIVKAHAARAPAAKARAVKSPAAKAGQAEPAELAEGSAHG